MTPELMLTSLRVENLGVLRDVRIEPAPGLTVVTGESGAGKSLLLGAIDLVYRARLAGDQVGPFADRARITLTLTASPEAAWWAPLEDIGVTPEDTLLIQREWGREGRTVTRIQGQPVPQAVLRSALADVVDITGQHEHQRLLQPEHARVWLDGVVDPALVTAVAEAWREWQRVEQEIQDADQLIGDEHRVREWRDDLAELRRLAPTLGEDEALESDVERLGHQERLANLYREALDAMDGGAAGLARVRRNVVEAARFDPQATATARLAEDTEAVVGELRHQLYRLAEQIEVDAGRLSAVRERLDQLARARRRFGVHDVAGLIGHREDLEARLKEVDEAEWTRSRLLAQREVARRAYDQAAEALTEARRAAAEDAALAIAGVLAELDMPGAAVFLQMSPAEASAHGRDRLQWWFRGGAGQEPRPLSRAASGGELSRIALAQSLIQRQSPIMVLDEVDAGLGGQAALRVRELLRRLADGGTQVLAVSHQAVVAAAADQHWRMEKRSGDGGAAPAEARIRRMRGEERIAELARMLSGSDTTVALEHARQLVTPGAATAKPRAEPPG